MAENLGEATVPHSELCSMELQVIIHQCTVLAVKVDDIYKLPGSVPDCSPENHESAGVR